MNNRILRDPDGSDGGGGNALLEALPEDLREEPSLAQFKDIGGLAKSYLETKKMVGQGRLEQPTEDWDQSKWDNFYNKIGRPEQPDGYEPPEIEGVEFDKDLLNAAKSELHKLGLNKRQFAGAVKLQVEMAKQEAEKKAAEEASKIEEGVATLKNDWKDKFDTNLDIAKSALKKFGGDELASMLDSTGLGNNPLMVKTFYEIGKRIMEDNAGMGRGPGLGINSETQARMRIDELKKDPEWTKALFDPTSPNHHQVKKEKEELYKMAYPGKTQI